MIIMFYLVICLDKREEDDYHVLLGYLFGQKRRDDYHVLLGICLDKRDLVICLDKRRMIIMFYLVICLDKREVGDYHVLLGYLFGQNRLQTKINIQYHVISTICF